MQTHTTELFDLTWNVLEQQGKVDCIYGAEYRRIFAAWTDDSQPEPHNYIQQGNLTGDPSTWTVRIIGVNGVQFIDPNKQARRPT